MKQLAMREKWQRDGGGGASVCGGNDSSSREHPAGYTPPHQTGISAYSPGLAVPWR